jgi:hypothetical protein
MIAATLVGLRFAGNDGRGRVNGCIVARIEPGWYLVEIGEHLRLCTIFEMHGWTFTKEDAA